MGLWDWFSGTMEGDEDPEVGSDSATGPGAEEDVFGSGGPEEETDRKEGPDLVELEHRVGELEDDLERNASRIESVQHSQEEVAERVGEMNDTVRDLLGVYEQLTADANPFIDGEESVSEGGRFGVVNGHGEESGTVDTDTHADMKHAPEERHDGEVEEEPTDARGGDVFTFEDAIADVEGEDEPDEAHEEERRRGAPVAEVDDDGSVELTVEGIERSGRDPLEGAFATNGRSEAGNGMAAPPVDTTEETPYLTTLADTYATDTLVFEWLAELVEKTGPAATLKAVCYYEDVGWIGSSVSADLEEYLAGPGIDVHVDPNEPDELTVEDHVTSYEYIRKLDAIRKLEYTA